MNPLKIGSLVLSSPVTLAPLAGYTDLAFRCAVRTLGGLGLAVTELLNPRSVMRGTERRARELIAKAPVDRPLSYQVYGHEPEIMADCARYLEEYGADAIDINMGCPQKKIARRGDGAGLMRTPETASAIVSSIREAVSVPVTAKIRLGWDDDSIVHVEFAKMLADSGAQAITVHARTKVQGFTGDANWTAIGEVVQAVPGIPVIGNGDIVSAASALRMVKETGCAGVAIGRYAMKDPWVLRDSAVVLAGDPQSVPPSRAERIAFMIQHLESTLSLYGTPYGAMGFRKWIVQYGKIIPIEKDIIRKLVQIIDPVPLKEELRKLHDAAEGI